MIAAAFPDARPDVLRSLIEGHASLGFNAGATINQQGEGGSVALVTDGHVGLRRATVDGRYVMPRIAMTGELAHVLPLGARVAAVDSIALTDSRVAAWPTEHVRSLAGTDPGLAMDLLDHVVDAFGAVTQGLDGLLHQDSTVRVARVLHLYRDLFFGSGPTIPRRHLPAMVGTSREMTSRVLRTFEARGVLARAGRSGLDLFEPAALEATALMRSGHDAGERNKFLANAPPER